MSVPTAKRAWRCGDKSCASAKLLSALLQSCAGSVAAVGASRTSDHQSLPMGPGSQWHQTPELGKGPPPTGIVYPMISQREGDNSFILDTTGAQLFHPSFSASGIFTSCLVHPLWRAYRHVCPGVSVCQHAVCT